jgi:fructose-bisphosphate aldolase class II
MGICVARFEAFGCAGHASKIKAVGLEEMQARYASGSLNQKVS